MSQNKIDHGLQICVLERGFICVGDATVEDGWLTIANAKYVRRWGTNNGLGELAANGPLAATVLDDGGTIKAPLGALIHLLQCNEAAWKR